MNEFWLWFMRPIAEFLGVLALLAAIAAVGVAAMAVRFLYWRLFEKGKGQ